jgi:Prephenate dehydratase
MRSIAFYGEAGAYTEQAAMQVFGTRAKYLPRTYISEVFSAVEGGVDCGVVPIENSIEGAVTQTYDQFVGARLYVTGEIILRINHCLIALPGVKIGSVRKVYSHPQALGQCRKYLEKLKVEAVPFYDTAGSVRMLKEEGLRDSAAIASAKAAEIYGMNIIARNIAQNKHNYTRFFIVSRKPAMKRGNKTSIIFTIKNYPGALYHALNAFAESKIDLTYIQSRPVQGQPWKYNFYADFRGDRGDEGVQKALMLLRKSTKYIRVLGSYRKAKQ